MARCRLFPGLLALTLLSGTTALQAAEAWQPPPRDETVEEVNPIFDVLILRPLGLLGTVAGAAALVVTLPFAENENGTLTDVPQAAREFVGKPAAFTFTRPLGQMKKDP
ncbi:MAG: hypothetical protein HQL56_02280, partial [Magnetococcales bacterium]|nr:hypothetical protein [Magnetococcales bacterium]